eukprot:6154693-Pyramimonas_sp.AAC.1
MLCSAGFPAPNAQCRLGCRASKSWTKERRDFSRSLTRAAQKGENIQYTAFGEIPMFPIVWTMHARASRPASHNIP